MLTTDGLQYTRFFMNKFIGKTMTDALHEFSQRLHELKITQIEHSLIIPIVLCRTDTEFVEVETVRVIRQSYLYALYVQMSATRTEDETKYYFENILQVREAISLFVALKYNLFVSHFPDYRSFCLPR